MKRNVIRIFSLVLMLALMLPMAVACTPAGEKAVISYGDYEVSRNVFKYLCCLEKTNYLYEAYGVSQDQVSSSELEDNPQIWLAKDSEGITVADTLKMQVLETLQLYLYFCQYAKDQGYELNSQQETMVKDEFAKMVARNFNDKKQFNEVMKQYGMDYDKMEAYNLLQALAYQGEDIMFGEGGKMAISEASAKKYFKENFITVDAIFINTQNKTFPNGKVVVLPEEEKAEKKKLADDVFARLQAGEDFSALCTEYADQPLEEDTASAGYTFEKGGFLNKEAEEKAFSMAEGEFARVDTDDGVWLLRRKALNMEYFANESDAIIALLKSAQKTAFITGSQDKFKLDEEFMNSLDIQSLPHVV